MRYAAEPSSGHDFLAGLLLRRCWRQSISGNCGRCKRWADVTLATQGWPEQTRRQPARYDIALLLTQLVILVINHTSGPMPFTGPYSSQSLFTCASFLAISQNYSIMHSLATIRDPQKRSPTQRTCTLPRHADLGRIKVLIFLLQRNS